MTEAAALRAGGARGVLAFLAVLAGACGGPEIPDVGAGGMEPAVQEAIRATRDALAADRGNAAAWGRFGMVLHAHRLGAPAGLAYAEAGRLDGEDHRWPHLHARLLETAEPARALGLADEALRRNPRFSPALALRARVLEAMGDDGAAEAAWEALREAAPGSVEAPLALGRRQLLRGELAAARTAFERVVERLPSSAAGWSFLAQVSRRLGDPEGAAEATARVRAAARSASLGATADPDPLLIAVEDLRADRRGREARARRAAASGDHDSAEAIYRRLVDERPGSADLHYNHGNALARLGRTGEAEAAYRTALSRDPDSSPAMANLANLLARSGRDREADDLYRRSSRLTPPTSRRFWAPRAFSFNAETSARRSVISARRWIRIRTIPAPSRVWASSSPPPAGWGKPRRRCPARSPPPGKRRLPPHSSRASTSSSRTWNGSAAVPMRPETTCSRRRPSE